MGKRKQCIASSLTTVRVALAHPFEKRQTLGWKIAQCISFMFFQGIVPRNFGLRGIRCVKELQNTATWETKVPLGSQSYLESRKGSTSFVLFAWFWKGLGCALGVGGEGAQFQHINSVTESMPISTKNGWMFCILWSWSCKNEKLKLCRGESIHW